ncbi:MAG: chitobiase/beta-hexosaminidase C-terminal domain-containing protein [Phycisphaerales bacterium]
MRSKQMLVRCGLLAVLVMSADVSAAPAPGLLLPGLASGLASLEVTQMAQVKTPKLDAWAVDWNGRIWLWISCATPGAKIVRTLDGATPQSYSPVCKRPLILTGRGTLKVRAFKTGMLPSNILVIRIR